MNTELKTRVIQHLKFKILNVELLLILFFGLISMDANAQFQQKEDLPSPRGAFLRSMVVPGWGHHYVDKTDWTRGQYHMAADAVMLLSYMGLKVRTNHLETNLQTYAMSKAGVDLAGRDRNMFIAVGNFDNLQAYNDYQLQSRNWDNLIADVPENQWNWGSGGQRIRYQDMREQVDKNNNQFPAIITLMVANRLVSGISAFARARKAWENVPEASFSYLNEFGEPGFTASVRFGF